MNNFSTLTSIISALGTAPIHRLSRTWAQVNARTLTVLEQLRRLMGSTKNFGEYRDTLHMAQPPCIPFFGISPCLEMNRPSLIVCSGVYLTDLTFIEDGIPSVIKRTNLINFAKRAKTAEVIRDIQQYQNVPYPLKPVVYVIAGLFSYLSFFLSLSLALHLRGFLLQKNAPFDARAEVLTPGLSIETCKITY